MAKLEANFSEISMDFEPIPADTYRVKILDVKDIESKDKNPGLSFELEVSEGEFAGRKVFDNVYLKQKDGGINKVSYGRVRAYANAGLGEEAAAGNSIDTDELKGLIVQVVITKETYEKSPEKGGGQGTKNAVSKVLPL